MAAIHRALKTIKEIEYALTAPLKPVLREAVTNAKKDIKKNTPKKTGALRKSVKTKVRMSKKAGLKANLFLDHRIAKYGTIVNKRTGFFSKIGNIGTMAEYWNRAYDKYKSSRGIK